MVSLNLETAGAEEVNESIAKSSGFVIGSPTLGGHMPTQVSTLCPKHDPTNLFQDTTWGLHVGIAAVDKLRWFTFGGQVATTLGALLRSEKAKNQMCGVFGSFGWSGEAVDELESRLKVQDCSSSRYIEMHSSK